MSQRFVEGVGLITVDDKLTEEEIQANIEYIRSIQPKYGKATFADGFNDTQSMIYRWWQKLSDEENERGRWLEDNVKQWGQHIGYYDSIALEAYYSEISANRNLTSTEQADREGNKEMIAEFKEDMYSVYDNNSGDVTEVQKKYGYTPEDIGVIDGLMSMMENPAATAGSFAGMLVKDPEMLLINWLRIPSAVAKGTESARKTITQATRIQPKYVRRMSAVLGNKRVQAGVGRGIEGSVYGGVYEALHDLTFKGEIDPENLKKGASMGFLLGTAFGAITKSTSNSWFVDRVGSKNAEKKWHSERLNQRAAQAANKQNPDVKPNNSSQSPPNNPKFRPTPEDAILPDGLTHTGRYNYWKAEAVDVLLRSNKGFKDAGKAELKFQQDKFGKLVDKRINNSIKELMKKKNPDGSKLFTFEEAKGMAARHHAESITAAKQPQKWKVRSETARDNPQLDRKWGATEEMYLAKKNRSEPDFEGLPKNEADFEKILPEVDINAKAGKPSAGKIAKAAAVGAVAGAILADEDKEMAALGAALTFGLARGTVLKGINPDLARMKLVGHKIANEGKRLEESMQRDATNVGRLIQKIISDEADNLKFLTYLENFSKKGQKKLILKKEGQEYLEAATAFHNTMEKFWSMGNKAGVLRDTSHITDYVTHIFGKELDAKSMERINRAFNELGKAKKFEFGKQRKIFKTIEDIAKEQNIITDPVRILAGYTQSLQKVLAGKEIVQHLEKTGYRYGNKYIGIAVDVTNKIDAQIAKDNGYRISEMPALKGKLLHPLIKKAIEDYYAPSIGSRGFAHKASTLNNAMKRVVLAASLFHAQALVLSGIYAGGLTHAFTKQGRQTRKFVKEFLDAQYDLSTITRDRNGNPIKVRNHDGQLVDLKGDFVHAEMLREIVDARLGIGYAKTNELTNAGYQTVKNFLDKRLKPLGKFQDAIDKITWDGIHDHSKMFTYLTMKQRLMEGNAKGFGFKHKKMTAEEAAPIAAQFANDAYGGQNFNKLSLEWEQLAIQNANNPKGVFYNWAALAATPTKKNLSNWLLLSPDWTISNINIGFKWAGMTKNLATKVSKGQKLTAKEAGEWNMYMGYMFRAGVSTSAFAYILHKIFAEDEKEFNLQDFWYTGRLDLGNGEEMVVSKQIAEPMHWVKSPLHTALNKGASLPKAAMEIMFGKQWISLKHGGSITGPTFDRGDPKDWAQWFGNKITPISVNPIKEAIVEDDIPVGYKMFQKAVMGFGGFPRYGKPEKPEGRLY